MKIILAGSVSFDRIMTFDGLFENLIQPDKLHILSISPLVKRYQQTRGGIAANIAYSLALLQQQSTLLTSVGDDAKNYISDLKKLGVDTRFVHFSHLPTATFQVLTDKNDCQVGGFYPGAMNDAKSLDIKQFQNQEVLVVISAHEPKQMMRQVQQCQTLKKRLIFDPGQQVLSLNAKQLKIAIQQAEVVIVNDYELGIICKKTKLSEKEISHLTKILIITLGAKGSRFWSKNHRPKNIPAVTINKIIDPTGAGDGLRAGFLYGYTRNWTIEKCLQWGSAIASLVIGQYGTQEHHFDLTQIKTLVKKNY